LFVPQVKDKTSNIFSWFAVYNFFLGSLVTLNRVYN
jgi:hypothetical protein